MARKKHPKQRPQKPKPRPAPKEKTMITLASPVWYYPDEKDERVYRPGKGPLAAVVTGVEAEDRASLMILTPGGPRYRTGVRVVHDDNRPEGGNYCTPPGSPFDLLPDDELPQEPTGEPDLTVPDGQDSPIKE